MPESESSSMNSKLEQFSAEVLPLKIQKPFSDCRGIG